VISLNEFQLETILGFPDSEHLGAAHRADTLGRRLAILHGDGPGVPHFSLGAALDTVGLHLDTSSFLSIKRKPLRLECQEPEKDFFTNFTYYFR
jgi:hypothetical protein